MIGVDRPCLTVAHPALGEALASRVMHPPSRGAEPASRRVASLARMQRAARTPILSRVALYRLDDPGTARSGPSLVVALDGWVDAGSAATTAAALIGRGRANVVATFDADRLFDYRARRPTLEIERRAARPS